MRNWLFPTSEVTDHTLEMSEVFDICGSEKAPKFAGSLPKFPKLFPGRTA